MHKNILRSIKISNSKLINNKTIKVIKLFRFIKTIP